jgi:MerR family copper efflux transcriptional regulator
MIKGVEKMMRIGELAQQAKVTPRTVRYYEGIGLIPQGEREGSGQHRYPEETVARLQKIDQLKALGLSLEEIGKVIHLYFDDPTGKRAKVKVLAMLRDHLAETDSQLTALTHFRSELLEHIGRFERWLDT